MNVYHCCSHSICTQYESYIGEERIIFISKSFYLVHFMIQFKYYRSNNVQTVTSFKILNDVTMFILLDLGNKI